jgi:hypothetical protein
MGRRRRIVVPAFVFTAALSAAAALLAFACGGTTGHEGLPTPGDESGDMTMSDASGPDPKLDARTFDVDIVYADRVLPDVHAPPESGSGASDGGGAEAAAKGGLAPCTSAEAGLTDCVSCQGNAAGICTPTEAQFVQYDIDNKLVTAPGSDTSSADSGAGPKSPATETCYECLVAWSCIDDTVHGDTGNECEDNSGPYAYGIMDNGFVSTPAMCEAVLSCILGSGVGATQCAATTTGECYCGTDPNTTCASGTFSAPVPAGVNGVCATQIAAGLGFPVGDGADIPVGLATVSRAAGRATQIFTCAISADCANCL